MFAIRYGNRTRINLPNGKAKIVPNKVKQARITFVKAISRREMSEL